MSSKRKSDSHSRGSSRPLTMKSGGSQVDSERDSGFSDVSSEHMSTVDTTDSEDSPRPPAQQGVQASASGPQASQLAVVRGSYSNLSSMIIMNNVLLKQSGDNPPALKPWGFSPAVEMVQPVVQQPQVVFLQPVVSQQASPASKEASSKHRRSKNYLPILKSYPKIAPHPGDSSGSSGRGTASSSSASSSTSSITSSGSDRGGSSQRELLLKEKRHRSKSGGVLHLNSAPASVLAAASVTSPLLQSRLSLRPAERSAGSSAASSAASSPVNERPSSAASQPELPVSQSPASTSPTAPQGVGLQPPSSPSLSEGDGDTKRKRFCNTYNILSQSGLLDIALRTKELHRLNRSTQADLERLKEQTDLFLKALLNGDSSVCVKLQAHLEQEQSSEDEERVARAGLKAD